MSVLSILQNCSKPTRLKSGLLVSCGQCLNCKANKANEWNMRASHELKTSVGAIFCTLTYKNRYLPKKSSLKPDILPLRANDCMATLSKKDIQLFNKRLRKYCEKHLNKRKIKMIYCGEYGESKLGTFRPHYHLVVFNITPEEINNQIISKLWGKGRVDVSEVNATDHAIMYVTGYTRKKLLTKKERQEYIDTGREPPFIRYSQGIGKDWCNKNYKIWSKSMKITYNSHEYSIPRYYINQIKKTEGVTYKVPLLYQIDTGGVRTRVKLENRYYFLEDLLAEKTNYLNFRLLKAKTEKLDEISKDKSLLKRDDYFEIMKTEENNLELHWKFYLKKCEDYVKYFFDEKRFVREKAKDLMKKEEPKKLPKIKWKLPKIHMAGELNKIAEMKNYKIIKGGYGGRQRIDYNDELIGRD